MNLVDYSHLIEQLRLTAVPLRLTAVPLRLSAVLQPVLRLEVIGPMLAVPSSIAPAPQNLLGHVLFALKHEGINLAVLAQALPQIPAAESGRAYHQAPNGLDRLRSV